MLHAMKILSRSDGYIK